MGYSLGESIVQDYCAAKRPPFGADPHYSGFASRESVANGKDTSPLSVLERLYFHAPLKSGKQGKRFNLYDVKSSAVCTASTCALGFFNVACLDQLDSN